MPLPRLADVARRHGPAYRKQHGGAVLPSHLRALDDIMQCRTPTLGGHLGVCARCAQQHILFHSCRNRACPRCGFDATEQWLDRQRALVLPVPYFHITFTLPSELRRLVRSHQRVMVGILFRTAYDALAELCADERHLGGRIGALAVLHTWTRALVYHPHIHMLVPAGAVDAQNTWRPARKRGRKLYLVPQRALAKLFAGKFLAAARKALPEEDIPDIEQRTKWIVAIRRVEPGPEAVLSYLGRYVHRTALSDSALLAVNDTTVTFRYRDSRTRQFKTMHLPADEFLRRFLQHVLPKGLHRVRAYGLIHPNHRTLLRRLQLLLAERRTPHNDDDTAPNDNTPRQYRCPHCNHRALVLIRRLDPTDHTDERILLAAARGPPPTAHAGAPSP